MQEVLQVAIISFEDNAVYLRFEEGADPAADAYNAAFEKFKLNQSIIEISQDPLRADVEIKSLLPFLRIELEKAKRDPEHADLSITDVLDNLNGGRVNEAKREISELIIERAQQARAAAPVITYTAPDELKLPIYKVTQDIFRNPAPVNDDKKKYIKVDVTRESEKRKDKPRIETKVVIDFTQVADASILPTGVSIDDLYTMCAAWQLAEVNDGLTTVSQIYQFLNNGKKPGNNDYEKINKSLDRLTARLKIDNKAESNIYNYAHFKYDGDLLHFDRCAAFVDGKFTDAAIRVLRVPALIEQAIERKQYTTVPAELIDVPVLSSTSQNTAYINYLICRIAQIKNEQSKNKGKSSKELSDPGRSRIKLSTLYEKCINKGKPDAIRQERKRALPKIKKILEHFKECGYIAGYVFENEKRKPAKDDKDILSIFIYLK